MLFIVGVIRCLLSLRYKIEVKGLDAVKEAFKENGKSLVFLPNHPAEIDPVILNVLLKNSFAPRPLVADRFFNSKGVRFFLKLVNAIPVAETDIALNQWKTRVIDSLYAEVKQKLIQGDNLMVYPAGSLKSSGSEVIGGASFVHKIISDVPQCRIVLIRTTGLWGSVFSRYSTGVSPFFGETLWKGFKILLKNGIFFTPRRRVLVEFFLEPKDFPRGSDRLTFNNYLEKWYNQRGGEEPSLVSYSFYKHEVLKAYEGKVNDLSLEKEIPPAIFKEVIEFLAKLSRLPVQKLDPKQKLSSDLGLDSLEMAEVHGFLQTRYEVPQLSPALLQTVHDVMCYASLQFDQEILAQQESFDKQSLLKEERNRIPVIGPEGSTLMQSFVKSCKRGGSLIACVDKNSGALTYKKLLITVLILAEKIRKLDGANIGILLPSTSGSYITVLATLFAGKTPVMLNWTAGKRSLEYAKLCMGLKTVISSKRFLERLEDADFGSLYDQLLYLEDIKEGISISGKLKAVWLSLKSNNSILKACQIEDVKCSDVAVVLFTSGTEALPKAVPLTHHNILFDQKSSVSCVQFLSSDSMYSVLPPFHSFGFCVAGLMPLLAGMKVFYSPSPTDTRTMALEIEKWKPTVFCAAPSFIQALFTSAKPEALQSLRIVVSGAEKMPDQLREYVHKNLPESSLIEGYGITECSPIVTIVRPGIPQEGVGLPIPGVEVAIYDEASDRFISDGEGEVCVSGPNVFHGYLGIDKDPFLLKEAKKWYRTGDRGKLTAKGCLIISGRYKRFIKIAAEMISLGGLEEDVAQILKKSTGMPQVAIGTRLDEEGKPKIVLFTTFDVDLDKLNEDLRTKGHARLVKISAIKKVSEIPLSATGKINHRYLEEHFDE